MYFFDNIDSKINLKNILKKDIIKKIINNYKKIFNMTIFILDEELEFIVHDSINNILIKDLIFDDVNYLKYCLKHQIDLAFENREYIIIELNGIFFSIIPIFIGRYSLGVLIIMDNSKGYITEENIAEICKDKGYSNKKYIEYFNKLGIYSNKEFEEKVRLIWLWLCIFSEEEEIVKIFKLQNIENNILKDIINNLPTDKIIKNICNNYLNLFKVDTISIFLKNFNNKNEFNFIQESNNHILLNQGDLKQRFKDCNYDIRKFINEEERYLEKYNLNVKSFEILVNNDIVGFMLFIRNNDKIKLKNEEFIIVDNILNLISNYYLIKNSRILLDQKVEIFYTLVDNMDVSIHVVDCETGKILYFNKSFEKQFNIKDNLKDAKEIFVQDIYSYDLRKTGEFYSKELNKWFYSNIRLEKWIDGREVIINLDLDITDSKNKDDTIQKLKWRDNISNLPNRAQLIEDLDILFKKSNKERYIILINVDSFGRINFSYGYKYGDNFILEMSNYLINYREYISIYHLGGAEFAITSYSEKVTKEIVELIIDRFNEPWVIDSLEQYCTVSIGVSKFPTDGNNAELIIKNATSALERAKLDSKSKAYYFDTESDSKLVRRLQIEYFLRLAVMQRRECFKVFYQPIVDTKTGDIVSAEALVRWIDPELGFIKPDEFIYLAEELGIINIIDNHVLEVACKTINKINGELDDKICISVNLSAAQLCDENSPNIIKNIIEKTGLDYKYVSLEITETTAVTDLVNTKRKLDELSSIGIRIYLDDFGTGYSSLNSLQNMSINTVKIDKHFIKNMKNSEYNYTFIKVIVELAHSADIKICCEGVETLEEWEELKKLNTDILQGYLFSRPLCEKEFIEFVKASKKF